MDQANTARNAAERLRDEEFTSFVTGSSARLLHIARLICGDAHQAEDLVQASLFTTYRKWNSVRREDPFAYTRRSIVNGHISWWRRGARREMATDDLPDRPSASNPHLAVERRETLRLALRQLTKRERTVVVLRFIEDLSERQTAEELDIAVGTVKSTTARALGKLRANDALLEETGDRR